MTTNGSCRTASTTACASSASSGARLLAVDLGERGLEGLAVLGAERLDGPVLLRLERADLALALDDEPERDGLHAAGGESGLDAVPEDRARLVADEPVEDAAGLLRVHLAVVDLRRAAPCASGPRPW